MAWPIDQPPNYPEPQRYYRLDVAALGWGELWGAWPALAFVVLAPAVAFCKLLRVPLRLGGPMPREISLQGADPATFWTRHAAVSYFIHRFQSLGFGHFTTFRIPELPYDALYFALLNPAANSYAVVTHLLAPGGIVRVWCEVRAELADGRSTETSNYRERAALGHPARQLVHYVPRASAQRLWEVHQERVAQIAPSAGGLGPPVSPEHYEQSLRRRVREEADFQAARGVYRPMDGQQRGR